MDGSLPGGHQGDLPARRYGTSHLPFQPAISPRDRLPSNSWRNIRGRNKKWADFERFRPDMLYWGMSAIRSGELLTKITTKVVVTGSTRNKLRRQLV
jgi:hypothetical protein